MDLCKEDPELAEVYQHKSVAEQNSVEFAWEALMDPSFQDLRDCIYTNEVELLRFRQLLVNTGTVFSVFRFLSI